MHSRLILDESEMEQSSSTLRKCWIENIYPPIWDKSLGNQQAILASTSKWMGHTKSDDLTFLVHHFDDEEKTYANHGNPAPKKMELRSVDYSSIGQGWPPWQIQAWSFDEPDSYKQKVYDEILRKDHIWLILFQNSHDIFHSSTFPPGMDILPTKKLTT